MNQPDLARLVTDYFEQADRFTKKTFDRLCKENPGDAAVLRRQVENLRAAGLLVGPVENAPEPDPWASGARDAHYASGAAEAFDAIGPYQPLEELGRGGQAVVYLAEDSRLHRPVALKVLKSVGPLSKTLINRFKREAEVASRLDHPGICAVYDAGIKDDVPYIAMRFVEGTTLADCIESAKERRSGSGKDDPKSDTSISVGATTRREIYRVIEVIEKAARALHVAHEAGIIHRDIKPGNIMITPSGDPVLLDFGLASDEDGGMMTLTDTGAMLGTPAYMSPEQLEANRLRLDRRTDVYSLGVTLFECLTLSRPYRATTREAIYEAIQYKDPLDARQLNSSLPKDLKVIAETALEKNRDKRYRTAEEFADDLARARKYEPINARPVSRLARTWRWARRRPIRAALLAVIAVGVPALAVLLGYAIATRPAVLEAERLAFDARVERLLEQGFEELSQRDPAKAGAFFREAMTLEPEGEEARAGASWALFSQHKLGELLRFLDDRCADLQDSGWVTNLRFRTLIKLGRFTAAAAVSKRHRPELKTPLAFYLAGIAALGNRNERTWHDDFRRKKQIEQRRLEAYRLFEQAVLTAPRARPLYHCGLAEAAWRMRTKALARPVAEALQSLWPDVPEPQTSALYCMSAYDPKGAISFGQKVAASRNDLAGYQALGKALSQAGPKHWPEAVKAYERALELGDQRTFEYYDDLARIYFELRRRDDAIRTWYTAVKRQPYGNHRVMLCEALNRAKRYDEALVVCNEGLQRRPRDARLLAARAALYSNTKRLNKALEDYRRAAEIDPGYHKYHTYVGKILFMMGRYADAIPTFEKVLTLKPDSPAALGGLADSLVHTRKFPEALAMMERLHEIEPKNYHARARAGMVAGMLGEYERSIRHGKRAIQLDPRRVDGHYFVGKSLGRLGRHAEAIPALKRASEIETKIPVYFLDLGESYLAVERYEEALSAYRRALRLKRNHPVALCGIGQALVGLGRFKKGLARLRKGHSIGRRSRRWSTPSAKWLRELRDVMRAERELTKVLAGQASPKNPAHACLLAKVAHRLGKHEEAAKLFRGAFKQADALVADVKAGWATLAARCAVRTATTKPDAGARRWRKLALGWLDELHAAYEQALLEKRKSPREVLTALSLWKANDDLSTVRSEEALSRFETQEQADWTGLWKDVDALMADTAK